MSEVSGLFYEQWRQKTLQESQQEGRQEGLQ